jgi:signal transduction histidine kinase
VQSLRKDIRPGDPNTEVFDEIVFEVNAASGILQNLLQFGKQSEPRLGPTRVDHCLKEVLTLIDEQIQEGKTEIKLDIAPDLPEIQADARLLQQVLLNIIMNAIQIKKKDLSLAIAVAPEKKGRAGSPGEGPREREQMKVSISDNGPGLNPADLEKIFRPFFTTKAKGTGLGLAISRTIIEKHGGTLTAESEVGKGTTFNIRLPI